MKPIESNTYGSKIGLARGGSKNKPNSYKAMAQQSGVLSKGY